MENKKQSIYEYMASQLKGNELPEDFSLPQEGASSGPLKWTDGAMDGIYIYHTAHGRLPEESEKDIEKAVRAASAGLGGGADRAFQDLTGKYQAIAIMDALLDYVAEHQDELDAGNIYRFAIHLIVESDDREQVKAGLTLMQLFDTDVDVLRDIIRSMGLADEFTLYSMLDMLHWEHANEELFDLIKHVHGWGRIHLLERLKPETEEIREWILAEGIHNRIMPEYSALTAFEKGGVEALLASGTKLPARTFASVGEILGALLDESAVTGISGVESAAGVLLHYLEQAERQTLGIDDYKLLSKIFYYTTAQAKDLTDEKGSTGADRAADTAGLAGSGAYIWNSLSDKALRLLRTDEAEAAVKAAVRKGDAVELAMALGIPYEKDVFMLMQKDFDRYYGYCAYLMNSPAWSEAVLDLYRKKIPWDSMEDDPREETGLGEALALYTKLDALLQSMKGECRTAGDILLKTLAAPTIRTRYLTLECLKAWTAMAGQPLKSLSQRIWDKLQDVAAREPRADLKEEMKNLLGDQ